MKIAMISMDYAFVTVKGTVVYHGEDGWNDPDTLKILLVKDMKSGSVFAHAIVKKGIDDMNTQLTAEKQDENRHKDWCVDECSTKQVRADH